MELQKYTYKKKTYTVDYHLLEFRLCYVTPNFGSGIEFVQFDSDLGNKILSAMIKDGVEQRYNKIMRR